MTADIEVHECRVPRYNLEGDGVNSAQVPEGPSFRPSGFLSRDGETAGASLNETSVDVVLVPCPGAHPDETWRRDPITTIFRRPPTSQHMHTIRTLSSAVPLLPALGSDAKIAPSWARGGIRTEVNTARVLSYDHGGDITNSKNLKSMADELMTHVCAERAGKLSRRPLFFICHSIGGLIVKLALTMAQRDKQHRSIVEDCYGVTFFATPHRGSSHLSNSDFRARIQELLGLSHALTPRLMKELRLDHPTLLQLDDIFKKLATELQIWTFYETEDSDLSGDGACGPNDIPLKAPITSMRSAILNLRHEKVYALQSTHANCASFGMKNVQTMRMYLQDLANAIKRAESMSQGTTHVPLRLEQRVKVEVHGFYETDVTQSSQLEPDLKIFSAKEHSLQAFWEEGPDGLLESRLNDVQSDASKDPQDAQFFFQTGRATFLMPPSDLSTGENQQNNKAGRSSARGLTPAVATGISRSGSGDDARAGESGEARDSMAMESSDGECSPRSQTPVARTRANSPSPEDHSGMQSEPRGYVSRPTTGESLVPGPDTILRPSIPHRQSSQQTSHLQLPGGTASPYTRERLESEPTLGQDTRGFSRKPSPINATRKFVWIHVPFNNPSWVRKVFDTLSVKDERNYLELFNSEHWAFRHTRGRHSQHHASYLKPACGYTPLNSKRSTILSSGRSGPELRRRDRLSLKQQGQGCIYLYFPFLHFDTYKTIIKRRELIKRRMQQGRTRPVPSDVAKETSRELQVIWEYLGHDPPVNCRRTLDQYRYPSLHDTRARDDDQLLYKMTQEKVRASDNRQDNVLRAVSRGDGRAYTQWEDDEILDDCKECENQCIAEADGEFEDSDTDLDPDDDGILDGNVLMVDQLWLWVVDTTSLITFFPSREGNPMEGPLYQQADLRDSILNEVNADLTRQCENALDLAALTVLHAVSVLIDRSSHPNLEIFRIFDEAVSNLTEKMIALKRRWTFGHRYNSYDYNYLTTSSLRAQHKLEDERAEMENWGNTSALLELQDIEEELITLRHLFDDQEKHIRTMLDIYSHDEHSDATTTSVTDLLTGRVPTLASLSCNGQFFLQEALAKLKSYRAQVEDILGPLQKTRHDFDGLLKTVQSLAQIDDARLSRQKADLASVQNHSILIFTVFTVIFLPLSFFTSLFGMNTYEWGGSNNLHLYTIGSIALPASTILVIIALMVAWSQSVLKALKDMKRGVRKFKERTVQWWKRQIPGLGHDDVSRPRARTDRQRAAVLKRERQRQRRINREMTVQDLWERHIEDKRDTQYEIPLRNRRGTGRESTTRARAKARQEKK